MIINGNFGSYEIINKVAETDCYRLYLCVKEDFNLYCLLQIAASKEMNGRLERAAYILKKLKKSADEAEEEYAKAKTDPKGKLNYDLGFPELLDSFICQDQGERWVNILAFRGVENASKMVPLINITDKDLLRVDLRTSAWIMGKPLKLFVLTHYEGISVGLTNGANILIEPDSHYVLFFDWSSAVVDRKTVPKEVRRKEISEVAQAVITALGGDYATKTLPDDGVEGFDQYAKYLFELADGREDDPQAAHENFYKIVDSIWKREFYPFTTKPLILERGSKHCDKKANMDFSEGVDLS